MPNIHVIGGNGWIGSWLSKKYNLKEFYLGNNTDIVIHLGNRICRNYLDYKKNIESTALLLEKAASNKIKVVYVSSSVVYDPRPSFYKASKLAQEELCKVYRKMANIPITIVRPANVYGPGQPDSFVIPTIVKQALNGGEVRVKNINAIRNFVYVDDVVNALYDIALIDNGFRTVDVGYEAWSVDGIIGLTSDITGKDFHVLSDEDYKDSVVIPIDSRKWPTKNFTDMTTGLRKTIEHYKRSEVNG